MTFASTPKCASVCTSRSATRADVSSEAPAFSGLGWQLVDATHNLPASGAWQPPVDFKSLYEKAWGVG